MKLSLIVGAFAAAVGAMACGGDGRLVVGGCDPRDPDCSAGASSSGSSGGGTSSGGSYRDSGVGTYDAGRADASVVDSGGGASEGGSPASDAGTSSSSSGSSSGSSNGSSSGSSGGNADASTGPGVCVPGNACGGLWECTDDCYTDKCCVLDCSCTDPSGASGTLECSLTCP